jgi:hypothetical protein
MIVGFILQDTVCISKQTLKTNALFQIDCPPTGVIEGCSDEEAGSFLSVTCLEKPRVALLNTPESWSTIVLGVLHTYSTVPLPHVQFRFCCDLSKSKNVTAYHQGREVWCPGLGRWPPG